MPNTIEPITGGYRYTLTNGDIVYYYNDGATVRTERGTKRFQLRLAGGTFVPSVNDLTLSFPFNNNIDVSIYPVDPDNRLPDPRIEYNVIIKKKINQNTITFEVDWDGITWKKIYGLDHDYDQAKCIDQFSKNVAPFTITPTQITDALGEVCKTRPMYQVNSYEGTAIVPDKKTSVMGISKKNGLPITRTTPSVTHLYIHRGEMTDALGQKAWVEDMVLDEVHKTLTFTLPSTWLKSAEYPVSGVCGVDPAYTELMASFLTSAELSGDSTWTDVDLTTYGVADSSVVEIICANQENGVENDFGVRANGSSLSRIITLHEAEGGGETHCRMFVQTDANAVAEFYHSDISDDDSFYIVGYWENVTFTEQWRNMSALNDTWSDLWDASGGHYGFAAGASCVHQVISLIQTESAEILGVRANGSSLERKILHHEAETGGSSLLDWLVKADVNKYAEGYGNGSNSFRDAGYFDSSMDFVEKWEVNQGIDNWADWDLTAYLDQDGRTCDFMLVHNATDATATMGVRAGSDTSTARTLVEHEAEDNGSSTGELSGFSMSAQSHTDGTVHIELPATTSYCYLTGYFKPAAAVSEIQFIPDGRRHGRKVFLGF